MSNPPQLLNDDGSASIATAFMTSHFAFRRDLARFAAALSGPAMNASTAQALADEWQTFHTHLHSHHQAEDNGVFPTFRTEHTQLEAVIARLSADHRLIDPLLERADRAFAELDKGPAHPLAVIGELQGLLGPHLALEEAELIPFLRGVKDFPPPPDDATADLYAEGFAWSTQGIASEVIEQLDALLPEILRGRLPAARADFRARCDRVWGTLPVSAARTPIPE